MMNYTQQSFYKSKEWEEFRKVVIAERTAEDGFVYCAICGKPILRKYDLIVHHKKELSDANVNDILISLNPDNVECVHFRCHNQLHERFGFGSGGYERRPKKVFLVYGSPYAGKLEWVSEVAGPDDIRCDMGALYKALSCLPAMPEGYGEGMEENKAIRSVVFQLRDGIYDLIKHRTGWWGSAYVIASVPRIGDRERLKQRIGADELIFIDTEKAVCMERAKKAGGEEAVRYVEEWFEAFQEK